MLRCDNGYVLRLATYADVGAIHALRESLALWQRTNGIVQWAPGEIPMVQIEKQTDLGEWRVFDDVSGLVAAVRITKDDPAIWTDSDLADAGYLHGLMVARARAGEGLGAAVLREAESIVRDHGRQMVRLDCMASNMVLRRYYEHQRYLLVGERTFPPTTGLLPVALFQKQL